jgi:hypothetical protein
MRMIYIDNFRGFSATYIQMLNVNFLVGENSSGKTSILWALKLLNDPGFLFSLDLHNARTGLGNFNDIVSIGATDRSYFRLGLIYRNTSQGASKNEPSFAAILLRFENKNGLAALAECIFQQDKYWFRVRIEKRRAWITANENAPIPENSERPLDHWVSGGESARMKPMQTKLMASVPFLYAVSTALVEYEEKKAASESTKQSPSTSIQVPDIFESAIRMQDTLTWIAPIRTKPKRTYDQYTMDFSEEGEHTPYLIKRLLSGRKQGPLFLSFLEKVGKSSGLFHGIGIHRYGRGETAPFELDVVLGSGTLGINNVGYGVSQSLPIFVELFARASNTAFAIQQPEVHLHPKAQASLGELIFDVADSESKRFVIETHSDYLIDRFRMKKRDSKKNNVSAQVIFFERNDSQNCAYTLSINDDGALPKPLPEGYRKFFVNEALNALDLG